MARNQEQIRHLFMVQVQWRIWANRGCMGLSRKPV